MIKKGRQFGFLQFLGPLKGPHSSFCGDLWPVLNTDLKSARTELSETYWHIRGV
jgi:hypothetical protein